MKPRATAMPKVSEFTDKEGLPMWLPDEPIRHKKSGQLMLVVRVFQNATFVVDMEHQTSPITPLVILERDYHYWAREIDGEDRNDKWAYHKVRL